MVRYKMIQHLSLFFDLVVHQQKTITLEIKTAISMFTFV